MAANHVLLALHRHILVAYLLPGRIYGLNLHVGNTTSSCSSSPYMMPGGGQIGDTTATRSCYSLSLPVSVPILIAASPIVVAVM